MERKLLATVEVFNQRFEIIFFDLDDGHLALRILDGIRCMRGVNHDGLSELLSNEPGGAFAGSVGPRTSRILRTASTPW